MLLLKTFGVMLLVVVLVPLGLMVLSIIPILIGSLFSNLLVGFMICLLILLAEVVGIMYYLENYKGNKSVK